MRDPAGGAAPIGVVGEGVLHTAIAAALRADGATIRLTAADLSGCSLVVTARDGWDTGDREPARAARIPWLPVWTELGRVVIGPSERPGTAGCVTCAELRRSRARPHRAGHDAVRELHRDRLAATPAPGLTDLAASTVAAVVAEDARRITAGRPEPRTRDAVMFVDLDSLDVGTHRVLPDPLCPHCGHLPDDTAERARVTVTARPKTAPSTYRLRSLVDEHERLVGSYVDAETGLIRSLFQASDGGLALAVAELGLRTTDRVELGSGRSPGYRTSAVTAIAEALERYGGMLPGGKRSTVRATYAEVREHAVDPRSLGLYPQDRYRLPGFAYQPFRESEPYRWVWGFSFGRAEPVLVPESYAYYHTGLVHPDEPLLAYEISNGCALGTCLEEAVLHGILEVAERDAFLMTWYARVPAPRIDLDSATDRTVPLLAAAIRADTGYRVLAFDITQEHGLPAVWAMAVDESTMDGRPRAACAAACHLEPERAAVNALSELGPVLPGLDRAYRQHAGRVRAMTADAALVREMDDHALLYADATVFDRFDFLTGSTRHQPFRTGEFHHTDLRDDLTEVIRRFRDSGMDVVVVDQTTPEHRTGGFTCVKVIIPGTLPMTFGHHHRRVHGLPRLPEDLNPHPHPFP